MKKVFEDKSQVFNNAYANCQVDCTVHPVSCSSSFQVSDDDLKDAPEGVDRAIWAQAEATGGCRRAVQDQCKRISPCECKLDPDTGTMHCHCYDPDSLNPPRPHRPDF